MSNFGTANVDGDSDIVARKQELKEIRLDQIMDAIIDRVLKYLAELGSFVSPSQPPGPERQGTGLAFFETELEPSRRDDIFDEGLPSTSQLLDGRPYLRTISSIVSGGLPYPRHGSRTIWDQS